MNLKRATFFVIVLIFSGSVLKAQTPSLTPQLKGKVVRADSRAVPGRPVDEIRIAVKDRATRSIVGGQQSSTRVDDWYHVAPLGALVDVIFDGGPCYEYDGHSGIRVNRVNEALKTVELQKTLDCKKLEELQEREERRRRARSATTASATGASPRRRSSGGAVSLEERINTIEAVAGTDVEIDEPLVTSTPSATALLQELKAEADRARMGEFFDTFQYKFALKSELYRSRPELAKILQDFRQSAENSDLFQPIGKLRPEMFNDVVRRQFQTSADVKLENVSLVVREESVSESIRGSATVALLNGTLEKDFLKGMRSYYRTQTASSPIYSNSLIALGRIGEDEDKARLYSYVVDTSNNNRELAMQALALTQLIEGPGVLPAGAKTLASVATGDKDPELRAFAVHSLRPFVDQGDPAALDALIESIEDADPRVREQAALALGVGRVERDPRVWSRLRRLAASDASEGVRTAARLSLTGKSTSGFFSMEASVPKHESSEPEN